MSTAQRQLFAATHNQDKLREIRQITSGFDWTVIGIDQFQSYPEPVETGNTLLENALIKARAGYNHSGLLTLADDSGLEVDALSGRPGVLSSRYAGNNVTYADNVRLLLSELAGIPNGQRTARFRCIMVLVGKDIELFWEGSSEGIITSEPNGSNGFGYDPVFWSPELGKTFAEATPAEKDRVSHRARALRGLLIKLQHLPDYSIH